MQWQRCTVPSTTTYAMPAQLAPAACTYEWMMCVTTTACKLVQLFQTRPAHCRNLTLLLQVLWIGQSQTLESPKARYMMHWSSAVVGCIDCSLQTREYSTTQTASQQASTDQLACPAFYQWDFPQCDQHPHWWVCAESLNAELDFWCPHGWLAY